MFAALVFAISRRKDSSKLSSLKESSQHDPQQPAFRLHSHEPQCTLSAIVLGQYITTKELTGHTPGFKRRGATQTYQDSKREHIQLQRYMPLNHHTAGTATGGYAISVRHAYPGMNKIPEMMGVRDARVSKFQYSFAPRQLQYLLKTRTTSSTA